jgi:hypothetical protein
MAIANITRERENEYGNAGKGRQAYLVMQCILVESVRRLVGDKRVPVCGLPFIPLE